MRKGTCKFFNGAFHNECCQAGIRYEDVTPEPERRTGKALRIPCHSQLFFSAPNKGQLAEFAKRGTCAKYTEPSDEEIAEHEAKMRAAISRITATIPLIGRIKDAHRGENWSGVDTCPTCAGILQLTHAGLNGHVWGQCETKGCVSWME